MMSYLHKFSLKPHFMYYLFFKPVQVPTAQTAMAITMAAMVTLPVLAFHDGEENILLIIWPEEVTRCLALLYDRSSAKLLCVGN